MFCIYKFFRLVPCRSQDDREAASGLSRFILDVTLKSPDEGSRQIKAESRGVSTRLKGLEELVWRGDAVATIDEPHNQSAPIPACPDRQFPARLILHRSLAVFCDVQERLQECLRFSGNGRKGLRHVPPNGDTGFTKRRLNHDTQIL